MQLCFILSFKFKPDTSYTYIQNFVTATNA